MSQTLNIANQFDRISQVYDETRNPLKETTIDKIASVLLRDGCSSILDVGVGTGRLAKPLQDRNFKVVGLDMSRGMILKAREKGIKNLVLADANHLPIREKTFDAAIFAHVLHMLDDPVDVFRSVSAIVRREIIAVVRKRDSESSEERDGNNVIRAVFQEASAKIGYSLLAHTNEARRKESEFLATLPPTELVDIQDELIETSIDERLSVVEKRAFRRFLDIPDDVLQKMVREVRASLPANAARKRIQYRRIEQMATWKTQT